MRADSKTITGAAKRPSNKAADHVVDSLRRLILSGEFERGARLPNERQLAQDFGMSQSTVREAIRVLESMSLVEVRHGSGTYVTANSQEFIAKSLQTLIEIEKSKVGITDILDLRRTLAIYSVGLAVERATEQSLRFIETLEIRLSDVSEGNPYEAVMQAGLLFQLALSAAAHNPLVYALESFVIRSMVACQLVESSEHPQRFLRVRPNWQETLRDDRRALMAALLVRDSRKTVAAMDAYLLNQHKLFSALVFADIDLSDPNILDAVTRQGLTIPTYNDFHDVHFRAETDTGL